MIVQFFCPRWGATDPWDTFCSRVKEAGYDGVETSISGLKENDVSEIRNATNKYGLKIIGQYYQSFEQDLEAHAASFEKHLDAIAELQPVFINAQTGKDYFSFDQNSRLIEIARRFTSRRGIPVFHETHRGKAFFAAHITSQYLERIADVALTLDISHWCNVHESLLADQQGAVDLALTRTRHIHSRVGHPEGPQVNDPRAEEWKEILEAHLHWWDKVVERHQREGNSLTITTEFGPAPYMPLLPVTQQPVANQWDVNVYMMNLLKKRYNV